MFIYKTTCLINGLIYIGQKATDVNINNYLGGGTLLNKDIKKFGRKNFIRETIEDNIDNIDLLDEREKYWINFYDSKNPEIGYNMVDGGKGISNPVDSIRKAISEKIKGRHHTEETKRKINSRGRHHTEETKRKIGDANRGEKNKRFGKKYSSEEREKVSRSFQGRKKKYKNCTSKYVGVSFVKSRNKWRAKIFYQKKEIHLGLFVNETDAAEAYNKKALEIYGENARLNIINNGELQHE
jgi:group I intron endonuclease